MDCYGEADGGGKPALRIVGDPVSSLTLMLTAYDCACIYPLDNETPSPPPLHSLIDVFSGY